MFLTYLRRELRRRARQASIIAIGLALGIGLVITVTALSGGVKNAQSEVLHSLYGQDTDITVSKTPTAGAGAGGAFSFRGKAGAKAGSSLRVDQLTSTGLGALTAADVTSISKLSNVSAVAGVLSLSDTKVSLKVPSTSSGSATGSHGSDSAGSQFHGTGSFPTPITVDGVNVSGKAAALGPLASATLSSGRTFKAADAVSDVAVVTKDYAKTAKLTLGSTVTLAKTRFTVVGIISPASASDTTDVYIPLARAQALGTAQGKSLKGDVNAIYVASASASTISSVSKEIARLLPGATVTNSADLASELTGSVASASSLANNLGRWLAIAVLAAAFLLASLLSISAVSRRVTEFGTLKALGWSSRRIVGQVVGEAIMIGIIGGIAGVALGFLGATLVGHLSRPLTAVTGLTTGTATPGGARTFTGGAPGAGAGANAASHVASQTISVHLSTPVSLTMVAAAVALAVLGGLVSGAFGGWRAARLRPASALARVA